MDLRERWMLHSDASERHQKSRIFLSRLAELQCAEWLEGQGWLVTGLEALRAGPDIEARMEAGPVTAFEVKLIGTEDEDFGMILKSLAGGSVAASVSPYSGVNYLIFRAYEAARQLARAAGRRIAVVAVAEATWWRFHVRLKHTWIDWANPRFLGQDPKWEEFLKKQRSRYPGIPGDMAAVFGGCDALWILRQSDDYQYELECLVAMRSA
ncbi:MAG: hypothetical protein HY690_10505 [Chloroflexi bacterium]|nr:hypothetical protein [Chloroflexota bacterium]